ncbi:MAG: DUF4440 domain-containing protein [Candidatus Zixiibacteriota bacterium]|nr:MAG: DUF4440 domain-containing protein [candidate division Zixibacteria bacterium]
MRRFIVLACAVVLILGLESGCRQQQEEGVPTDLQTAIDAFYAAVEAGDVEAHIEMFTEDARMMPNHWTMYEGKEAIAAMMRAGEGWVFRIRDREVVDIDVSGDIAYTVNSYFYTWHSEDAEPQWHKTKNVHIWKKDDQGEWKLHVDIWNSDVPMSEFGNE